MPWNKLSGYNASYGELAGSIVTWSERADTLMPRFEHVYPIVSNDISVDFEYRVQSEFYWIVASETPVHIESFISNPVG
jgi:hypothetical protein